MAGAHAKAAWAAVADSFRALCIGIDSPRSLKAHLLLKYGELEQLVGMKIKAVEYCDAYSFAGDYAVVSFLKKNADIPLKVDRRGAAITAFKSSEERCKATNARVEAYLGGELIIPSHVNQVIHLAVRKISKLLQEQPCLDDGPYSWGPGATLDLKKREAYPDTKLTTLPFTVTGSAWKHAARVIKSDLHWKEAIITANSTYSGPVFRLVPGGRYDTVPKTVLTDRSILVEPRLNTLLQKRIGEQLRGLLKRVGVDLDDQSRNQSLASFAKRLQLATLDLEAASDSVSRKVVELLLPPVWLDMLDDLRSKWYQDVDGSCKRLEKFSSMGNGFTFELESLIFWALAEAASDMSYRYIVGVYGDDIIVHADVAPLLTETFTFLGFTVNTEKSFVSGEFFESCGKHYFGDFDVTPAFQKCTPTTGDEAAKMGNRLLRLSCRLGLDISFDERVYGAWTAWFRHWKPKPTQCGPYVGIGDGYWETDETHYANRIGVDPWGHRCRVECYSLVPREIPLMDEAMYSIWLMQSCHDPTMDRDPKKDRKGGGLLSTRVSPLHEDSVVSIKGTVLKNRKAYALAKPGFLHSRVKTPVVVKHRIIRYDRRSASLTW